MLQAQRLEIRDPIHGLVQRRPLETKIMNTDVFQRLRRIRQLAMAHLVYPGALHTRFEHSVGTMYIAGRICERLRQSGDFDDERTTTVRLAALLHDVGHGPFSHVSELVLERHQTAPKSSRQVHEQITAQIIRSHPDIRSVLGPQLCNDVALLLEGETKRSVEHQILSSSLDADKMDYLLRDSYFCGVEYGKFDLDKIVDACRAYRSAEQSYLAFDEEGVYAIEQLVLGKYHMAQQVYFHRIRAITDAMLVRGLMIAVDNNINDIGHYFIYDGSDNFIELYLTLSDDQILHNLASSSHTQVSDIFRRLLERRLFKQICSFPVAEVPDAIKRDRLSSFEFGTGFARSLEQRIATVLGVDAEYVMLARQSVGNPTFRTVGFRLGNEEILILRGNTPARLQDFPDLIFNFNTTAISREVIRVFAPKDDWNDPEERKEGERNSLAAEVKELILAEL